MLTGEMPSETGDTEKKMRLCLLGGKAVGRKSQMPKNLKFDEFAPPNRLRIDPIEIAK